MFSIRSWFWIYKWCCLFCFPEGQYTYILHYYVWFHCTWCYREFQLYILKWLKNSAYIYWSLDKLWCEVVAFLTLLRNRMINSTIKMSFRDRASLCSIHANTTLPFGLKVVILKHKTNSKLEERGVDVIALRQNLMVIVFTALRPILLLTRLTSIPTNLPNLLRYLLLMIVVLTTSPIYLTVQLLRKSLNFRPSIDTTSPISPLPSLSPSDFHNTTKRDTPISKHIIKLSKIVGN